MVPAAAGASFRELRHLLCNQLTLLRRHLLLKHSGAVPNHGYRWPLVWGVIMEYRGVSLGRASVLTLATCTLTTQS